MDTIQGAFTTRLLNITKAGEDIYVRGHKQAEGWSV